MKTYDGIRDFTKSSYNGYQNKRAIPFILKFKIWSGFTMSKIGIITFLFMVPFTIGFVSFNDLFSPSFNENDPVAFGHITRTFATNASIGEEMVFGYEYQYKISDGKILSGTGYSTGDTKNNGDEISVLYKQNDPERSVAADLRSSLFGGEIGVFVLLFQGIGLLILILSILKAKRRANILKTGAVANGKLLNRELTNVKIDKQTVYKLTFEFAASDSKTYQVTVNSYKDDRLEDETYEKLVYNPENPRKAVLLDQLPAGIKEYFLNMT
jgi:hypothetical protein